MGSDRGNDGEVGGLGIWERVGFAGVLCCRQLFAVGRSDGIG